MKPAGAAFVVVLLVAASSWCVEGQAECTVDSRLMDDCMKAADDYAIETCCRLMTYQPDCLQCVLDDILPQGATGQRVKDVCFRQGIICLDDAPAFQASG
ncbi:unnamed protein product [Alopecurus aequalis]